MHKFITGMLLATCLCLVLPSKGEEAPPTYDAELARQLGADDYGMKTYVMAFLKSGSVASANKAQREALQRAHLTNIRRLAETGKLVLAGPFLDSGPVRGIYLFDVATVEEARALTASDPAVKAGVFVMELHRWYGSAAIMQLNGIARHLEKKAY